MIVLVLKVQLHEYLFNKIKMNMTFKEKFLQEKDLQQVLYEQYGYQIEPMNQIFNNQTKKQEYPVTANIKIRNVAPVLYKNQRIQQVERQILAIQKQRKMRQKVEDIQKSLNKNVDVSAQIKMNNLVKQYNYLIDHKHIKQKGSDQTRKILKIQPKTTSQKIIEQIKKLKQDLMSADIKHQFLLNKQINELYKQFKSNLDEQNVYGVNKIRAKSQKVGQNFNLQKLSELANKNMLKSQYSQKLKSSSQIEISLRLSNKSKKNESQRRNLNLTLHSINTGKTKNSYLNMSLNQKNHSRLGVSQNNREANSPVRANHEKSNTPVMSNNKNIQKMKRLLEIKQPYVSNKYIQNSELMDNKIKNNKEALQLWKGRIAQAVHIPQKFSKKQSLPKSIQFSEINQDQKLQEKYYNILEKQIQLKEHKPFETKKGRNSVSVNTVEQLRSKNQEQQKIVSSLLQKRNCKYLRPWGTKILVKFNAVQVAKDMLGLKLGSQKKQKSEQQTYQILHHKQIQNQNQQMNWNHQIDEEYYWTMCKNQKINLLLKSNKR